MFETRWKMSHPRGHHEHFAKMKTKYHTFTRAPAENWKKNPTDIKINQFLKTNEGNNNSGKKTEKYKIETSTKNEQNLEHFHRDANIWTEPDKCWTRMNWPNERKNCFWWLWQKFSARRFFVTSNYRLHSTYRTAQTIHHIYIYLRP